MEELIAKLTALLGDEAKAKEVAEKAAADGVTDLASAAELTEADFTGYGVPKVKARLLIKDLVAANKPAPAAAPATAPSAMTLLPSVPTDDAFLESLRVGGVLKPQATDVLSAVRAILAHRIGIFDIEDTILERIESRAESLGEPVAEVFYELEKAKGRKAHADVLRAIGVSGSFVTEKRKKAFLGSVNGIWASLSSFQEQIHNWRQTWQANMSNPAALVQAIGAIASGGAAAALGVGDAPDAEPISDAATAVIDDINKMFAGTGVPVARALAADAVQLRQLLDRSDLLAAVGTTTREEMLKTLGLAVSADVARAERSVSQYVLGVLELPKQPPGQQLTMYIIALETLGASIPWEKLSSGSVARPNAGRTAAAGRTDGRGQTY